MVINGILVDEAKGFAVMRGTKVLRRYASYEEAWEHASQVRGGWVRYWEKKGS